MKQYLRAQQVADHLGISKSSVWRWASENRLPKPIKLAGRTTVWDAADVQETVEKLAKAQALRAISKIADNGETT